MNAVLAAVIHCPHCGKRHIEQGKWATFNHKKHLCYGCNRFFETNEANVGVGPQDTP